MGIPCRHVIALMSYQNLNHELFIYACYMSDAYRLWYRYNTSPINGMNMHIVDIEHMPQPTFKQGTSMSMTLRYIEHNEIGSRTRIPHWTFTTPNHNTLINQHAFRWQTP